ncbi:hypothetical protein SELMODRAFT_410790 [Selaginella moellendorffii]|uniref:Uncharacterized protein n=1 Tax=Selaginella moellendorffii TaxID=88036 RepID=D8RFV9_SELML|nr:hypothetical protein SELMODRAFT_410790 [Selaginella moellendorffii]
MAIDRLLEAECLDPRSGLYRRSAREWQALRYLKAKQVEDELVKLAEDDLREAECFHAATSIWGTDYWRPEAYDADLFYFLAILYVSRCDNLHDIEALSASASVSIAEIRRLVCFAQVILRSVITVPRVTPPTGAKWENEPPEMASSWDAFLDFKDKDSARAALELGWRSVPSSLVEQLGLPVRLRWPSSETAYLKSNRSLATNWRS